MGRTVERYCWITDSRVRPRSASVPLQPADEADVVGHVHEDLDVEQRAQRRVDKQQDAFDQNDIARLDADRRGARVCATKS